MATAPIIDFRPNLAAMVLAYKRNRSAEYQADRDARGDDAQEFCNRADALAVTIAERVNTLLSCEGVTLADLADAEL